MDGASAALGLISELSGAPVSCDAAVPTTPSTAPDATCDSLAKWLGGEMPRGPHIGEMSRLRADPRQSGEERFPAMLESPACIGLPFARHGDGAVA